MNLFEARVRKKCKIKNVKIDDFKSKIRLMELGLTVGAQVEVFKKSLMKQTLLIFLNSCCFTLKENFAKQVEVEYE